MMNRLFLFLFLLLPAAINAQISSTTLDIPALTVGRLPSRSSEPVVTFDKRIRIIARGAPTGSLCLYINTRSGDMGIRFGREELGVCGFNINDENFRFTLFRATGQVQSYTTRRQNGVLKHSVMTGNTEVHPVSFPSVQNTTLRRQAEVDTRRRDGVTARAYRAASGAGPKVFLFGRAHPPELAAQDFLGFGAIGYLKTNRGVFMAVKTELATMSLDVVSWQDVPTEFDMHPFESLDIDIDNAVRTKLDREESKLRTETYSGECGGEQDELRRLKLNDIATRRQTLARKNRGNIYEDETTRKAAEDLMMPNFEVMHQELEVKICRATASIRSRRGLGGANIERRIQCHRTSQEELARIRSKWEAIEARHGNDISGSYLERARVRRELLSLGSGCR